MKIEAWTGPGGSWGGLGSHFGSQGLPGIAKMGQIAKMCPKMGPHLGVHFWVFSFFFYMCLRSFSETRFGSYQYWFLMDFGSCFRSFVEVFLDTFRDSWQVTKISFWYSIYYVLSTSASWKVREKTQILVTFLDCFSRWLPTSCFHRFGLDLDSILGGFLKV